MALTKELALNPFLPTGNLPLSDELYEHLRAAIQNGNLELGQRLVEDAIAGATSVSRTPVREALRKLVDAGLAVNEGRGLVVTRLNAMELQERWEVLTSLWVLAVGLAVENRSDADIAEMSHIVRVTENGDRVPADRLELNLRFQSCLLRTARNSYLAGTIKRISGEVESLVNLRRARSRADLLTGEEEILEAIKSRNQVGSASALRNHMSRVLAAMLIELEWAE